jgi:hypothetical protein
MKNVSRKFVMLATCLFLLLSGVVQAIAQRIYVPPPPRVYNPARYQRTRVAMSNRAATRAALRAALKKKRARAARKNRAVLQ